MRTVLVTPFDGRIEAGQDFWEKMGFDFTIWLRPSITRLEIWLLHGSWVPPNEPSNHDGQAGQQYSREWWYIQIVNLATINIMVLVPSCVNGKNIFLMCGISNFSSWKHPNLECNGFTFFYMVGPIAKSLANLSTLQDLLGFTSCSKHCASAVSSHWSSPYPSPNHIIIYKHSLRDKYLDYSVVWAQFIEAKSWCRYIKSFTDTFIDTYIYTCTTYIHTYS